ncbi:unnamed protein product [Lactuca saligna]|uniref:Uncharacterized protein n=1 Tax=Lactuca saligna TaxID=75948 RepID=A0AA36EFT3_LACSI|nr:unnamed protein product [Lactuca saligna]
MSTTNQRFKNNMEKKKRLNNDAYDDLMKRNPKTWCRACFATNRACEAVENGISKNWMVIPSGPLLEVRNGYEGYMVDLAGHNARTRENEKIVPPPKEKKPPGRPKKPHSDEAPSKRPTTSGGRGGRGPIRARGGRGSYTGTSGGRGGRSLIDEIFDSPTENEVINMFDNFEEELYRAEMEREKVHI